MPQFTISIPPGYSIIAGKTQLRKVLRAAGNEIAAKAKASIRQGAATKKRSAKRQSIPGQPPVGRTGNLARGIGVTIWRNGEGVTIKDKARSPRGSGAPYALFLEKGAQGGIGSGKKGVTGRSNKKRGRVRVQIVGKRVLLPRPFIIPALEQVVASGLTDRVREAIINGLEFKRAPRGGKSP